MCDRISALRDSGALGGGKMFDVLFDVPCRSDVNFAFDAPGKSSRASFGSVFCLSVCSLANGIMSQFVGRCQAVVWEATL